MYANNATAPAFSVINSNVMKNMRILIVILKSSGNAYQFYAFSYLWLEILRLENIF